MSWKSWSYSILCRFRSPGGPRLEGLQNHDGRCVMKSCPAEGICCQILPKVIRSFISMFQSTWRSVSMYHVGWETLHWYWASSEAEKMKRLKTHSLSDLQNGSSKGMVNEQKQRAARAVNIPNISNIPLTSLTPSKGLQLLYFFANLRRKPWNTHFLYCALLIKKWKSYLHFNILFSSRNTFKL